MLPQRSREPGDDDWNGLTWKLTIGLVLVGAAVITGALRLVNHGTEGEQGVDTLSMPLKLVAPLLQIEPPSPGAAGHGQPGPTSQQVQSTPPTTAAGTTTALVVAPVAVQPVAMPASPAPAVRAPDPVPIPAEHADVVEAVQAWAEAWSRRDLRTYYASYTPDFHGRAQDRNTWERERYVRISLRRQIQVTVSDLQIEGSATTVQVRFMQGYASDVRTEKTPKLLTMTRSRGGKWLISDEQTPSGPVATGHRSTAQRVS